MKVLKKIIIAIVIIIAIPLIAGLFIKSEYAVVKEVTIQKQRQEVFDYIKFSVIVTLFCHTINIHIVIPFITVLILIMHLTSTKIELVVTKLLTISFLSFEMGKVLFYH